MFMLFPYQADVPMSRWPISNFVIIGITVFFFVLQMSDVIPVEAMILDGWHPVGFMGHIFLHADFWHLFGNMLFLFVFGNAICAKLGNRKFIGAYLFFAITAALFHNCFDGGRAIGASGAINGVVGAFLILYPHNQISCYYLFLIRFGTLRISSIWLIAYWLVFDIWGILDSHGMVAYWAHVGGFLGGAGLAIGLISLGIIHASRGEKFLFDSPTKDDLLFAPIEKPSVQDQGGLLKHPHPQQVVPHEPKKNEANAAVEWIRTRCACGKRLKASAKMKGKKSHCPGCSAVIQF